MCADSFLKDKPGGVMETIAFKACIWEGRVCRDVIVLDSLVLGDGICTFVAGNYSMGFKIVEINRGQCVNLGPPSQAPLEILNEGPGAQKGSQPLGMGSSLSSTPSKEEA
eukprot:1156222-Pelagomonas_calceolata.AAC.5